MLRGGMDLFRLRRKRSISHAYESKNVHIPSAGFASAGFTPLQVSLANGQNMHAGACQLILVGFMVFSTKSKKP
jgi:hypothetical protein